VTRSYSELIQLQTFEDRFTYLALGGNVGHPTFGYDRWLNQLFYTSLEWREVRNFVIARDEACDLAVPGFEIHRPAKILIHHMNPMSVEDVVSHNDANLDPEGLITVTHQTHNAIHYGDVRQIPRVLVERRPGDTTPW